jgi:phosphotransferase system HPr (HPr) family protein
MKVRLPDALHARPANLLVRLAAQHDASVVLHKGTCRADARKILEVLSLGAAKGDEIEISAEGEGAVGAIEAIAELVLRSFDSDLVPDRGSGAVEGIAIGRALVVTVAPGDEETRGAAASTTPATPKEERARLREAEARALAEIDALIAALPPEERALLEPERAIVREVAMGAAERVGGGETSEAAVVAMTENAATDLIADVRARLLEALDADGRRRSGEDAVARASALGDEVVLVAERLTPSLVARMPGHVRGIVAVDEDPEAGVVRTSHAAILARGRELPLALVPSYVAMAITEGDLVVVDTTASPARVWVAPSGSLVEDARARQRERAARQAEVARVIAGVKETLGVAFLVNLGSVHDRVPEGVAGVGLLRTELLFAARARAPSEGDQVAALLAIARAARGAEVTARLWDAGGDKPLAWLPAHPDAPDERGAALLFRHRTVLETQLAAIARAAERAPIRALLPMTRAPSDVNAVRAILAGRGAGGAAVRVGAMIETPEAALGARAIAEAADFVCVGTNDLASLVLGSERTDAKQALDPRVLVEIARIIERAHGCGKKVTICGEVAADPRGARILVGLGVDALSVAPPRLADAARALEGVTLEDCQAAARAADVNATGEASSP